MPTISLVLPTYNVSPYIDRCLKSCINQTYKDFEVIIVDDCGSDDSIDKAKFYEKIDSRIRIIHNHTNLGTYQARKRGVDQVMSPYVLFLDPDDELELNAIENIVGALDEKVDIAFYGSRLVPGLKWWQKESKVPDIKKNNDKTFFIRDIFSCNNLGYGTEGKVIKTSVLLSAYKSIGNFDHEKLIYGEDVLLFFGILMNINSALSINDRLYIYHRNETSITKTQDKIKIQLIINQLDFFIDRIEKLNTDDILEKEIKNNIINRFEVMRLVLINKISEKMNTIFKLYIELAIKRGSIKPLIKLVLYMLTFGKFKL